MSALTMLLPVPLWFVVIMVALCVAWQFAMWGMVRALRDLYGIYQSASAAQHGTRSLPGDEQP